MSFASYVQMVKSPTTSMSYTSPPADANSPRVRSKQELLSITNLLNNTSMPTSAIPSGLPTPDNTPVQKALEHESPLSASSRSPSLESADPVVVSAVRSAPEDTFSLFSSNRANSRRSMHLPELAFHELDVQSRIERADSLSQLVLEVNAQQTYMPGQNFKMDALLHYAAEIQELQASKSKSQAKPASKSPKQGTSNAVGGRRRDSAVEHRSFSARRQSTKKRFSSEEGAPEAKRMRAAAVKKEKPLHFTEVADYCPPLSTMNIKKIKDFVQKGNRQSNQNDVNRKLIGVELNDLELKFAEMNQLDINKYLINKRKVLQGRVRHYLQGNKNFTKTHAQGAAIIDVNKASRLWEFYEQAGWLDIALYGQHLAAEMDEMRKLNLPIASQFLS